MKTARINWNVGNINTHSYTCGYCGNSLVSEKGWQGGVEAKPSAFIYVCHYCTRPTFFDYDAEQVPGASLGDNVADISDDLVSRLYDEARKVISVGGYTAAVLCSRKLLMHIAVDKGADKGKKFIEYVEFLSDKGYVPPDAKDWVDQIRKSGNEATHEIVIKGKEEAEDIISFVEMILKLVYEFPAKVKGKRHLYFLRSRKNKFQLPAKAGFIILNGFASKVGNCLMFCSCFLV